MGTPTDSLSFVVEDVMILLKVYHCTGINEK